MEALFPDANPLALDLLGKMMEFDQNRRLTVDGALSHPYLMELHSKAKVRTEARCVCSATRCGDPGRLCPWQRDMWCNCCP